MIDIARVMQPCRARQSSLATQATAPQAILFRVARADGSTGARGELVVRDDRLNPGEAATRTLELVASSSAVFPPRFNLRQASTIDIAETKIFTASARSESCAL